MRCNRSKSSSASGNVLAWGDSLRSSRTNSAPERPLICRSTGSISGNFPSVSVATTRRRLSSWVCRARTPPKYAQAPLAKTMANTTTDNVGSNN